LSRRRFSSLRNARTSGGDRLPVGSIKPGENGGHFSPKIGRKTGRLFSIWDYKLADGLGVKTGRGFGSAFRHQSQGLGNSPGPFSCLKSPRHAGFWPFVLRAALVTDLDALPPDAPRILLSTGKLVGESFDHPPLDTLVLAMPVSWKGTLQQYAVRLHREHARKTDVRIIDFVDTGHPALLRMWDKRQRGYRAMGYRVEEQREFGEINDICALTTASS
jgi:hypothetical protein